MAQKEPPIRNRKHKAHGYVIQKGLQRLPDTHRDPNRPFGTQTRAEKTHKSNRSHPEMKGEACGAREARRVQERRGSQQLANFPQAPGPAGGGAGAGGTPQSTLPTAPEGSL